MSPVSGVTFRPIDHHQISFPYLEQPLSDHPLPDCRTQRLALVFRKRAHPILETAHRKFVLARRESTTTIDNRRTPSKKTRCTCWRSALRSAGYLEIVEESRHTFQRGFRTQIKRIESITTPLRPRSATRKAELLNTDTSDAMGGTFSHNSRD